MSEVRGLIERLCAEFTEWEFPQAVTEPDGPLAWPGYDEQREHAAKRTGLDESVVCGRARIGVADVAVIGFEFGFMGGSVGRDTGTRIVATFEHAREQGIAVVSLIASGGSRIQEGIVALSQLQHISKAMTRARQAGVAHIAVVRQPTTGGMWASLAVGADVVLALGQAAIAFGGSRVRTEVEPDPGDQDAFTAEGKYRTGQVDQVVDEADLPLVLGRLLALLPGRKREGAVTPAEVPHAVPSTGPVQGGALPRTGWEAVQRARDPRRPRALAYLESYFANRFELSGDRVGGADPGMLCGFGRRDGKTIAYAAQAGVATTPAGFRTASRVFRLADRLGFAVLTLVDTPGAANDAEAERGGLGPAIAELFETVAAATVPITTLVIGQGGSGGALALASPERTWIVPDAYFAVIAPESAAAILKRDSDDAAEIADGLRLRPQDLHELGFVHGIAKPEP